jgi:radical SAM protein with 4Fe4S-binding SPASM domain
MHDGRAGGRVSEATASLFARAERATVPLAVTLELTRRCNFRCAHCYVPDLGTPSELPTERILRLLDELAEAGTLFLVFTGGEPMLRPEWRAIACRARALGFAVEFLTNGSTIDEDDADTLAGLHALVSLSLHAVDPETFEAVTRVPGSLASTLAAIDRLRARGVDVQVKVPLSTINADAASAVFRYAEGIGVPCDSYVSITARSDGNLTPLALRLPPARVEEHYRQPYARCPIPAARPGGGDEALCAAGSRTAHVTVHGDVLACIDLQTPAGNVLDRPFREIWEESPWLARLRALRRGDLRVCGDCAKLAYCGRCHAQALAEDGDLLGPSTWACEHAAALERVSPGPAS